MGNLLHIIFDKVHKFKGIYLLFALIITLCFGWSISKLHIEEDITRTFPRTEEFKKYEHLYRNSSISGNVIVAIGPRATLGADKLISIGETVATNCAQIDTSLVRSIRLGSEGANLDESFGIYVRNLPYFLHANEIDSLFASLDEIGIHNRLNHTLNRLRSYESIGTKKLLALDPLDMASPVVSRLSDLQSGSALLIEDGYTFTPDGEYLLLIVSPSNPPSETVQNTLMVDTLEQVVETIRVENPTADIMLFGGPVIAVGNSRQIKKDTALVSWLAGGSILLLLILYFRSLWIPILFFLPPLFGLIFALGIIALWKGSISAISIAAGTIVMGIAIDYCFHFFNHYKETGSVSTTLKEIASPILLGCFTTVMVFFCLNFLHSQVLADFGTFAGLSLIGTAAFALLVLPHLVPTGNVKLRSTNENNHPDSSASWLTSFVSRHVGKLKLAGFVTIVSLTIFFWQFAGNVQFEDDLNRINYFPEEMQRAQDIIVGKSDRESLFVLSSANTLSDAIGGMSSLTIADTSARITNLANVFLSPKEITKSVAAWNRNVANSQLLSQVRNHGTELGFRPEFFASYDSLLQPVKMPTEAFYKTQLLKNPTYRDLVFTDGEQYSVVSTVNISKENKGTFKQELAESAPHLEVVARSSLALDLVNTVSNDLNFILMLSAGMVFLILLLTYGRIELALVTFLPMAVSWIWIMGLCGLLHIKFNMVNVLITTFIFGLGDDYSIFISDGILSRYKYGIDKLKSFRSSIILSAITTILGTGVLIFSKHPALHSIAVLSVLGMVCVAIVSFTLQPILYGVLIESRVKRGFGPLTLVDMLTSALAFGWFVIGCLILTSILLLLIPIPIGKPRRQRIMMFLISKLLRSDVDIMIHAHQRWLGKDDLEKPAILIANHSSFVDLMLMIGSSDKLLLVTNDWVWNSPFFGFFIRYVEYIHAKDETSYNLPKIREKINQGYSILIFPEGTRSRDGRIGRFKKGAFYLAEQMQLDILPVVLHGVNKALRKGDFAVNKSLMTIKYLPRITPDDMRFGEGYSARTKAIARYFKEEYEVVRAEVETPHFFADQVRRTYFYKGPILEWYVKIKLMLERNFEDIIRYVPAQGTIYDLGCGYGYLTTLLAMQGRHRNVVGVDYDDEKVQVAQTGYYDGGNLSFATGDLMQYAPQPSDCFIIKDVLHYMPIKAQERLLNGCATMLNSGGVIIVRDGMAEEGHEKKDEEQGSHAVTKLTEFFSITVFGFNKAEHGVNFPTEQRMKDFAMRHGLKAERFGNKASSNVVWVFKKD